VQWPGPGSLPRPMRVRRSPRLRWPSPEEDPRRWVPVARRQGVSCVGGRVEQGRRGGEPGGSGGRDAGGPVEAGELDGGWVVL